MFKGTGVGDANSRILRVGLEELARTLDDVKGVPAGSRLAAFPKILRPLVK